MLSIFVFYPTKNPRFLRQFRLRKRWSLVADGTSWAVGIHEPFDIIRPALERLALLACVVVEIIGTVADTLWLVVLHGIPDLAADAEPAIPLFTVIRRSLGEKAGHVRRPFSNNRATACRSVYSPRMPSFVASEGKTGPVLRLPNAAAKSVAQKGVRGTKCGSPFLVR